MPNAIQFGEYSMDSGMDDTPHNTAVFNQWNDERNVNVNRNDNDWNDNWWFAGVSNYTFFSLVRTPASGEFCFESCPCHPPSILPASSSFSDSAIYFFASSDFVSHRIMSSTWRVSVLRMASRTNGSFSSRPRNAALASASIASMNNRLIFPPSEYR